ncbi:MAG: DUF2029 domain-containing protein [Planctomycetes bacterium]|nr:DUF2029 domain-containing protein [Planctomycetota bacterium]
MGGLRAAFSKNVGGDFLRYHRAGRLVATGNADHLYDVTWLREQRVYREEREASRAAVEASGSTEKPERYFEEEFKYLPATAVLLAPVGALHPRTGWIVWGAWNGALIAIAFAAAWSFAARGASWRWALIPLVLLLRAANDNANLGQLNPSAIAPAMVALWALDRGRDRTAGALAGIGAVVKFLPVLLAVFFLLKRRFVAAAMTIAVFAGVAWVLPATVLGHERTATLTAEYRGLRERVYTEAAPPDVPGHSVKSFVYRVFGGTHYQTGSGAKRIDWDISVTHADPETLRFAVYAVIALLFAVVAWAAWGVLRSGTDVRGPPEAGLFVCFMLLASPEARSPHFLYLALPAMALTSLLVRAWRESWPRRHAAAALAAVAALLVNTDSESIFGRELANRMSAWCGLGWATLLVFASLVVLLRDARRRAG